MPVSNRLRLMEQRPDPRLLALLAWYRDLGVTGALTDEPLDWLARGDRPIYTREPEQTLPVPAQPTRAPARGENRPAPQPPAPVPVRNFAAIPAADAEATARSAAEAAQTLQQLRTALESFDGCALRATAKNLCFYRGATQARLMIIGEAPGRDEDLEGKPFVGRAGQLLDRMLAAIGLSEESVHITNIVYWRPPGNRTPTPQEALVCQPFLMRQIELVQPDALVLLGGAAAKHVLGATQGILRIRGKWHQVDVGGRTIPAMPTLHPAYLLRTPASKRQAWRDLLAVRARIDEPTSPDAAGHTNG